MDYSNPIPDPMGHMSHQEIWNVGAQHASAGVPLTPMPGESDAARMARENGYAAEQRRLAEIRRMQGGY